VGEPHRAVDRRAAQRALALRDDRARLRPRSVASTSSLNSQQSAPATVGEAGKLSDMELRAFRRVVARQSTAVVLLHQRALGARTAGSDSRAALA
jgi:hypothetical protein